VFDRRHSVSSRVFAPQGAGIRHRVSVSVSKALFCFCHHSSNAERIRDSATASIITGCVLEFSFPSSFLGLSRRIMLGSSINKAEVFIFFSTPLALVSVSVSAGLHCWFDSLAAAGVFNFILDAPFWFSRHDFSSALFFLSGSTAMSAGSDLLVEVFVLWAPVGLGSYACVVCWCLDLPPAADFFTGWVSARGPSVRCPDCIVRWFSCRRDLFASRLGLSAARSAHPASWFAMACHWGCCYTRFFSSSFELGAWFSLLQIWVGRPPVLLFSNAFRLRIPPLWVTFVCAPVIMPQGILFSVLDFVALVGRASRQGLSSSAFSSAGSLADQPPQ
jgi:hypothetical protein